ncbi:hypothetical protein [uncultured Paludibaculum sp.]|uniref:hypothetical protein n=1 Tax=uncultured Paludibaculum sp. TaxID=1765020 RepID=UPI002AAA90F0|nr:hypothetical protein [uncultured Paludibaculum sp.]
MIASAIVLTAALMSWKAEIESKSGTPVFVAVVEHDEAANTYQLAADTPNRGQFASYLKQEGFLTQFSHMYSVMIHHKDAGNNSFLVMLNGAKRKEWTGHEEALLAHEFGHAWIKAQGYPTPIFINNRWACIGIHTADIAQHVLIRAELERRGIDARTFWLKSLDEASDHLEKAGPPPEGERCLRVQMVAQLVDIALGLKPGEWAGREAFEQRVRKVMPELEGTTTDIVGYMRKHDMVNRDEHREALKYVFEKLKDLAYGRTKDYQVYVTLKKYPHAT